MVIIVVGAGAFLMGDAAFNVWGLMAAMISNVSFPTRNIFLKKLSSIWDNPLQKFAVMSIFSTVFISPVWLVKVVFVSGFSTDRIVESLTSSVFHSTYNLASISVLEYVNPVTHAILNISKRLFVIMANIIYFNVPFTLLMFMSLVVLLVGCYLYQLKNSSTTRWVVAKCVLIAVFFAFIFLPIPGLHGDSAPSGLTQTETQEDCVQTSTRISTAWIYDRPIPQNIIKNIKMLAHANPDLPVYVYCGTSHCVKAVDDLENSQIKSEFAVTTEILKATPLEQWLAYHSFYKVLARKSFETNLQDAVRIGLLWKYGGFYVSPTVNVSEKFQPVSCQADGSWVSELKGDVGDNLDVAFFTKKHPFIQRLAQSFVHGYPKQGSDHKPFKFDFKHLLSKLLINVTSCGDCPKVVPPLRRTRTAPDKDSKPNHFGALSFQSRVKGISVANLGDEIQDFPGLEYMPFIDHFVERDNLLSARSADHVLTFFNAWWGGGGSSWPAPDNIEPIMLSVHLHGSSLSSKITRDLNYVKKREPIGCRDPSTLKLMYKYNIKAYFSGCMTLMITNPNLSGRRNDKIYIVDVNKAHLDFLPQRVRENAVYIKHNLEGPGRMDSLGRFTQGYELMKQYAEARLVITSRIHCGLPCVAMNTPVIFFNGQGMPGGGGSKSSSSTRIAGLTPLFHTLDFYQMTHDEVTTWLAEFNWDNPPPNPEVGLTMRLKASFWDMIRRYPSLYDAGRKFGTIPMSPPVAPVGIKKYRFHVVFTSEVGEGGSFGWHRWRSVESILHHHPTSEVIVHSNTLPQDTFNVLSESAYSIKVQRYDLRKILTNSPASDFLLKLDAATRSSHWQEHEANLVRLLAVYDQGGVAVDTDTILVRPIDRLPANSLVWWNSTNTSVNANFLPFEKGHSFLSSCLSEFSSHFSDKSTGDDTGRNLLTRVWRRNSGDIRVLNHQNVLQLTTKGALQQCLQSVHDPAHNVTVPMWDVVDTQAYAVGLNFALWSEAQISMNTMKPNTVCAHVLNSFCVLCNNLH